MSIHMTLALGVGLVCFLWPLLASALAAVSGGAINVPVWIGFVGCTSYFVAGGGKPGVLKALACNYTGIAWAMLVFAFGSTDIMQSGGNPAFWLGALATGFISWGMTYQAKAGDLLALIPCTFMACFSTFASGGDWENMLIGVTLGSVLVGVGCTVAAGIFARLFGKSDIPLQPEGENP